MAVTLDSTIGGASSNSFGSLAEAEAYFEARLYSDAWSGAASDDVKKQALIMATQQIVNETCWTGSPATTTQALPWARTGMYDRNGNAIASNVIPQDLKNAQFEMALALLKSDRTTESDVEALGLTKLKAGPVELGFSGEAKASVVTSFVRGMLPSSWLCEVEDPNAKSVVFEAL